VCEFCGARSSRASNLKRHILLKHADEKARHYQCAQCPRAFQLKQHLDSHVSSVHLKVRTGSCALCGHDFSTRSNLLKHMRVVHAVEASTVLNDASGS